jgi:hypothetical protein
MAAEAAEGNHQFSHFGSEANLFEPKRSGAGRAGHSDDRVEFRHGDLPSLGRGTGRVAAAT